jgi:hypothetical protein
MADSGEWRKIVGYLKATGVPHRVISTYRPGAVTATGNPSRHGRGLAVDFAGPTPSRDSDQLLRINLAFKPVAHLLHELIYSGPGAYEVYNEHPHDYSGVTRRNHHDHVHVSIDPGVVLPAPSGAVPGSVPTYQEDEVFLFHGGPDVYVSDGSGFTQYVSSPALLDEIKAKFPGIRDIGHVSGELFNLLLHRSVQADNLAARVAAIEAKLDA